MHASMCGVMASWRTTGAPHSRFMPFSTRSRCAQEAQVSEDTNPVASR
jgi:hypothetical protein